MPRSRSPCCFRELASRIGLTAAAITGAIALAIWAVASVVTVL
jgi:hypothetical protein